MPYPLLLHSNPFTSPLPQTPSTLFTHTENSSVKYPLEYLESKIVFVSSFLDHHKGHWYMLSSGHGTPTHHIQHTSTHHIQDTSTHHIQPTSTHHIQDTSTHHIQPTSTHHIQPTSTHHVQHTSTHHIQYTSTHHIQYTPTHLGCSLEPKRSHHSDVGPGDG